MGEGTKFEAELRVLKGRKREEKKKRKEEQEAGEEAEQAGRGQKKKPKKDMPRKGNPSRTLIDFLLGGSK